MNGAWGFNITDRNYKSVPALIATLVRAAGTGTNLLLNVGPRPDGTIQPEFVQRLREIGQWLQVYGRSIYGTRAGPVPPRSWGATTRRGDTVFVHVVSWPDRVLALPSLGAHVRQATLLSSGQSVSFSEDASGGGLTLTLPQRHQDEYDQVVVVLLGPPRMGPPR
ncbi:MAG TPA: alpha-L-fucosidase, partial [Gemmatimonadaceae bacterium]